MKSLAVMCAVLAGCHSHGSHGDEEGPSRSGIRARITSDVRTNRLEERIGEGRPTCDAVTWVEERATCARDGEAMVIVDLRRDERAYFCPEEGIYWYHGSGVWLGPFRTGLSKQ